MVYINFQISFLEPLLSGLENRLLSFQHSDFSDTVDLRIIANHCSNLTFLAVNAASLVISGDTYNDNESLPSRPRKTSGYQPGSNCNLNKKYIFPNLKGRD